MLQMSTLVVSVMLGFASRLEGGGVWGMQWSEIRKDTPSKKFPNFFNLEEPFGPLPPSLFASRTNIVGHHIARQGFQWTKRKKMVK